MTRRQFICSLTAASAMPVISADAPKPERARLSFSTLGCPKWDWGTVLANASKWGYAAVELRGLQGEMDLTKRPEFSPTRLAASLKDLAALDLRISDLGASTRLHEESATARAAQLDEGKRYIDLAHRMNVPYIRVFGDRVTPGQPKAASIQRIISGLRELGEHGQGSGVTVLIESHGDFCDSPSLLEILTGADRPNVALLWDAHHTVVAGKEEPAVTWEKVGRFVRHVHLKDSKPAGQDVKYVLTGAGTIPLRQIVQVLVQHQFSGYYSFEWEKVWHPEIEEPEVAIPQFAKAMQGYFSQN